MTVETNGRIGYRSCPCCVTVLVLVHEQPYRAKVDLFQLCRGKAGHAGQTNWTFGVKCACACYGLPSVSVTLFSEVTGMFLGTVSIWFYTVPIIIIMLTIQTLLRSHFADPAPAVY